MKLETFLSIQNEQRNNETFKCENCGNKVLTNTKYCVNCQKKVSGK